MEIVCIIAQKLWAVQFELDKPNEFEQAFDNLQDSEYLFDFFENFKEDLECYGQYSNICVEDAVRITRNEAKNFEKKLRSLEIPDIDSLFKPLENFDTKKETVCKTKGRPNHKSWIRIYAVRIENYFIVTGGTIKLTQYMNDREHTKIEKQKLERCIAFLKEQGICDLDGFKDAGYFDLKMN